MSCMRSRRALRSRCLRGVIDRWGGGTLSRLMKAPPGSLIIDAVPSLTNLQCMHIKRHTQACRGAQGGLITSPRQ